MLSSVTVALAIMTVSADGAGQPSAFRLSDYVRKTPATTAQSAKETTKAPVRLAPAPKIVARGTATRNQRASFSEPVSGGPVTSGPVMGTPMMGAPMMGAPTMSGPVEHFDSGYPYGGGIVEGPIEGPVDFGAPCADCGPVHPHHHAHVGYWSFRGLPSPWCSRADMPHHIPYLAHPKNYYYFRPYQWFHIPEQQAEVTSYGGDPRHPYANREFQEVYQEFEAVPHVPVDVQSAD